MRYKIKETWLDELYTPAENYLNLRINNIIGENNLLNKNGEICGELIYKGKLYRSYAGKVGNPAWFFNTYELHPNLIDKMETYLVDAQELTEEHKTISRFLSIVLPKLSSMSEIKEVFGDNLYNIARQHYFVADMRPTADRDIYNLSIEYEWYIDTMKNRMIDNLLAKDLYDANR